MFENLRTSLKMETGFDQFTPLIINHLQKIKTLFERVLNTSPFINREIRTALQKIPEESLSKLICSPYLSELLIALEESKDEEKNASLHLKIVRALVAEIKMANISIEHPVDPIWNIDGDHIFDEKIRKRYPLIRTSSNILINYQSYAHNSDRPSIGGYSYEWGLKHKERIETALELIQKSSFAASDLVGSYVTIIQFRQNLDRVNAVNSSSHRSIGLIACDNFHKIHSDLPEIVDMLVHEAIHQHLHLFEEQVTPFISNLEVPTEIGQKKLFPSPWSGKKLDISSYSHAILVWYGLVHFWSDLLTKEIWHSDLNQSQAKEKLNEALRGFQARESVLDNLGDAKRYLNSSYVDMVERMEDELYEQMYKLTP